VWVCVGGVMWLPELDRRCYRFGGNRQVPPASPPGRAFIWGWPHCHDGDL